MNYAYNRILFTISVLLFTASCLGADETPLLVFEIHFAAHGFLPLHLAIPAGKRVRLKVVNSSPERIEFESFKLNREKVVGPGETVIVDLPPLKAGTYDFFDDFHADVPEGEIVAQ